MKPAIFHNGQIDELQEIIEFKSKIISKLSRKIFNQNFIKILRHKEFKERLDFNILQIALLKDVCFSLRLKPKGIEEKRYVVYKTVLDLNSFQLKDLKSIFFNLQCIED